jgi:hypothetical protein
MAPAERTAVELPAAAEQQVVVALRAAAALRAAVRDLAGVILRLAEAPVPVALRPAEMLEPEAATAALTTWSRARAVV